MTASANYRKGIFYKTENDDANFEDGLWHTHSSIKFAYERLNANLNLNYRLSSRWTIGGQAMLNAGGTKLSNDPYTYIYDYETGDKIRSIENISPAMVRPSVKSFNIFNEFKIDTTGKKISLNVDYFYFKSTDSKEYGGHSEILKPHSFRYFEGKNVNDQYIPNISCKLDVEYPLKWINLSFGGKVSNSIAKNTILGYNSGIVDQLPASYSLNQSRFKYTENVEALYFSGTKKINSHWEIQAGSRLEATQTETFSENSKQVVKKKYAKLFPTAYVNYTRNEYSNLTFNYSRRINRPSFFELNPNAYYLNPTQIIEGNPFLQPAFIDNVELVQAYKKLQSKLYFSYEDNMFAQLPLADPATSFILYTNQNYFTTRRYGILENYVMDKFEWWTSTNEIDFNYTVSVANLPAIPTKKGFSSRVSTSNDFILNSKKTILFNLGYWYSFPSINGIFNFLSQNAFSIGCQYLMLDKNLKISAKVYDPFRTEKDRMNTSVNGVYQNSYYYHDSQSFQLSVSYKFGNNKIKEKQHEAGNEEERRRTGG